MINALRTLPCFNHVEHINEITSGSSQSCFKIKADNRLFFAKTINDNSETQTALHSALKKLSPPVFYHDQNWLVTEFIDANNLALTTLGITEKIRYAISLMVRCHQLSEQPDELAPNSIINNLIAKSQFSTQKKKELLRLAEIILPPIAAKHKLVCCHGDLNFSNILIDKKKHTWLVDYECACSAPIEYDLAMLIAVNNIPENKIALIIAQYEYQSCAVKVDSKRLTNYLTFSYFINSLWYKQAYQNSGDANLLNLHQQQWVKFISIISNNYIHDELIAKLL